MVFLRMRWVVFLRAVNVGGANRCQPAMIAKELAKFGVVNIGAVGTFVVREDVSESDVRAAIAKKLPFKCEIMICPAKEIRDLAKENPLTGESSEDIDAHVAIRAKGLTKMPKLPIYAPSKDKWEIKILRIVGTAVLSLRRAQIKRSSLPKPNRSRNSGSPGHDARLEHSRKGSENP